ncbi:MAG: FAD-dependent oxidoreductase, partial [Anaerolineales bacterium]
RLPKGVLQQDIDDILDLGIVLKTNSPINDPASLLEDGYNAVCLATGIASRDHSFGVEGEDADGVLSAATFLRKINLGEPIRIGNRVAVVGGGITALDTAAVARRLGAEEVILALDRPRGELPAYHWEMAAVEAEGISLLEHVAMTRILTQDGKVVGIELAKTIRGTTVDEHGRRRAKIEPGSEFKIEVDTVIGTVGQQSDLAFLDPHYDELTADRNTLASEIPGIFVVGGRKTGASYIVDAIGLGHRVATSIHRHLQGEDLDQSESPHPPDIKITREEIKQRVALGEIKPKPRVEPSLLPMEERLSSFREVVLSLTERQAREEAKRCLQCGICSECLACVYACGVDAIDHNMIEETEQIQVGAVILAPGYQTYQAELSQEYGFGRYPNVITSLQLERMLSASGPTEGHVMRPSDGLPARRVAFLQCVGSRDTSHDYCSAVCCMYATKEALFIKEHDPEADVHVLMMDIRAFSKGYEAYYQRAEDEYGIRYTRCRVSEIKEEPGSNNLIVRYVQEQGKNHQSGSSSIREEICDLVVLSVGMEISESVQQLGRNLGIELDEYGFCHTTFFNPIETSRPGIYAVGPFREPKDIPESVIDASGAAGRAAALLAPSRGTLARHATFPPERDVSGEEPRVGVFVCHCGSNIAGYVDVEAVTQYASTLPGVVHADHLLYACSQDSSVLIKERIQEHNLNRIVVASCTPVTHEALFQESMRQTGLNEHLFAMANIRNQCSWVHSDTPKIATQKAKDLTRMAIARVLHLEALHRSPVPVQQNALVIGGGPAGMTAALTLAEQGFPVDIVEREPLLGGNLRRIFFNIFESEAVDQTSPQQFLGELISKIETHPEITVHLSSEVVATSGFVGNFSSKIRSSGGEIQELSHGATVVATGGQEYRGQEYGYGTDPRILTQQTFEAHLACEAGLTDARPETAIDLSSVQRLAMIQCIGPAEEYCARICCTTALKNALLFKRMNPKSQVVIFHRDLRAYGFKERLYQQALEAGIVFWRYDPAQPPQVSVDASSDALRIQSWESAFGEQMAFQADLLILSTPAIPAEGHRELGTILKVPVDMDGWFLEAHVKLRPVEFASSGVFLAGAAHYPKLLDETIVQAQAAASRAATVLSRETLSAGGAVANIDPLLCVGCLTCVRICPFGVPQILPEEVGVGGVNGAAYIEPSACQGCGTCVGECPANAIELLHYRHDQIECAVCSLLEQASVEG